MSEVARRAALDTLAAAAGEAALPWSQDWRAPLEQLLTWLARFSARTNLVGDHAAAVVAREHLLETLTVAAAVERAGLSPARIVDVGAGAGLEVLLLGLWAAQARLVAVEPRRKRADFIELAGDAMGLGRRLLVIRSPVPPWRPDEPFDLATSRATFAPAQWLAQGRRLVRPGGVIVVHDAAHETSAVDSTAQLNGLTVATEIAVPGRPAHRVRAYRHVPDEAVREGS